MRLFFYGQMKKHLECDAQFSESFTEVSIMLALRGAACKDRAKLEIRSKITTFEIIFVRIKPLTCLIE